MSDKETNDTLKMLLFTLKMLLFVLVRHPLASSISIVMAAIITFFWSLAEYIIIGALVVAFTFVVGLLMKMLRADFLRVANQFRKKE